MYIIMGQISTILLHKAKSNSSSRWSHGHRRCRSSAANWICDSRIIARSARYSSVNTIYRPNVVLLTSIVHDAVPGIIARSAWYSSVNTIYRPNVVLLTSIVHDAVQGIIARSARYSSVNTIYRPNVVLLTSIVHDAVPGNKSTVVQRSCLQVDHNLRPVFPTNFIEI